MRTILVVEADTIVRNVVIDALAQRGYTVYEAATVPEALTLCKALLQERLDLLIVNYDAADRAAIARLLGMCANVLAMAPSAAITEQALPGASVLRKPFTIAELVLSVEQLLRPQPN